VIKKKTVVHLLCVVLPKVIELQVIGILAKIKQDSYYCSCFEYLFGIL